MDIKVNGIGFKGHKEVVYALTKAAQKAKDFEYYSQPAIASRLNVGKQLMQEKLNASMNAYLDMALRDEAFEKTIQEMKISELYFLHEYLLPEKTQYSIVEPSNKFKSAMQEAMDGLGRGKANVKDAVSKLYKKLEL